MAKLKIPETAGFNAGKSYYAKPFRVEEIVINPEIAGIFKITDKVREAIKQQMKKFGYDKSQPVVVQKGTNILLDGHTRYAAAKEAGLEEIPVVEMDFEDWQERNHTPLFIWTLSELKAGRRGKATLKAFTRPLRSILESVDQQVDI